MTRISITFLLLILSFCSPAQALLPEPNAQHASNANYYYENRGQIIDHAGNLRSDVLFYTEQGFPKTFIMKDRVAFTHTIVGDTLQPGVADTALRIDMKFVCDDKSGRNCARVVPYEISQDYLNYYMPHCPAGVTNVKGYARIVYENAFPNIDVHLYSNSVSMKMYFVVKPGGNPGQINMQFQGQDSISMLQQGDLNMYLKSWKMQLGHAYAYEIDNNSNTSVLAWAPVWNHNGTGMVSVQTGTYNTAHTLVIAVGSSTPTPMAIDNMDWSVYYGADLEQRDARICAGQGNTLYHAMSHWDPNRNFPVQNGVSVTAGNTYYDWYISRFDNTARHWGTYYIGSKLDQVVAIASNAGGAFSANTGVVWVAGVTCSNDVPPGDIAPQFALFQQAKDAGQGGTPLPDSKYDGLLVSFDNGGNIVYKTYFGGTSEDMVRNMYIDPQQQYLYLVGNTRGSTTFANSPNGQTNGSFPLYSGLNNNYYFKNQKCDADKEDGFIAQFSLRDMHLMWSTLFGGSGKDNILTVSAKDDILYIGGQTWDNNGGLNQAPSPASSHSTCNFPLSNPNDGVSFFQNSNNGYNKNMFVAAFTPGRQLFWSTLLGFSVSGLSDIKFNSKGEILCLGSYNISTQYAPQGAAPNSAGLTPLYDNGSSYFQGLPATAAGTNTLLKFSANRKLLWSTPLAFTSSVAGATGTELSKRLRNTTMAIDRDHLFITTGIVNTNLPTTAPAGNYLQAQNASNAGGAPGWDSYIISLNPYEQLTWATYLGGGSTPDPNDYESDFPTSLAVQYPYLYISGETNATNAPYNQCIPASLVPNSYCDQSYYMGNQPFAFDNDVFISRFKIDLLPTSTKNSRKEALSCTLYPNPVLSSTTLSIVSKVQAALQVRLYDKAGRLLRSMPLALRSGLNSCTLDCTALPAGLYCITLTGDHIKLTQKMIKL